MLASENMILHRVSDISGPRNVSVLSITMLPSRSVILRCLSVYSGTQKHQLTLYAVVCVCLSYNLEATHVIFVFVAFVHTMNVIYYFACSFSLQKYNIAM